MEEIALDLGTTTWELHGRPATIPVAPFLFEGWGWLGRFLLGIHLWAIQINPTYVSTPYFNKSHVIALKHSGSSTYAMSLRGENLM